MSSARVGVALLASCHPGPTVAVTAFVTAYAALSLHLGGSLTARLALAVLTGQLSIGWSNDAIDVLADRGRSRRDKPTSLGLVPVRALWWAAGAAAAGCVLASLALGLLPGALHLVGVAAGWLYNLGLKRTLLSPLPYGLAFGLLPAVATQAAPTGSWPEPDLMLATALLGVAAHFANTVGDAEADAASGVRGLPQRVGPQVSMVVTAVGVGLAAATLLIGPSRPGPAGTGLLAAGVALAGAGTVLGGAAPGLDGTGARPGGRARPGPRSALGERAAFPLTLVAVALVLAGVLATGGS